MDSSMVAMRSAFSVPLIMSSSHSASFWRSIWRSSSIVSFFGGLAFAVWGDAAPAPGAAGGGAASFLLPPNTSVTGPTGLSVPTGVVVRGQSPASALSSP